MKRLLNVARGVTALMIGVLLTAASASPESSEESKEKAADILSKAAARLAGEGTFAFEATVSYEGTINGEVENIETIYTVAYKRPDAISVHVINSEMEIRFVSNGKRYIRYIPEFGQFMDEEDEMLAGEVLATSGFDLIVPALELMSEVVQAAPFADAIEAPDLAYVGEEMWKGIECDRIRFTHDDVPYDLWIQRGDDPLVRKISPSMATLEEELGANAGVRFKIEVAVEFTEWEMGVDVDERIAFNPGEGVEEVASFRAPSPADRLKGKMAPDFTVALLDGSSLTLSDKIGDIVILDFWATWCGPCRIAMPVLEEVAKEIAADGVHLYGVNLQEDPDRIRSYLESKGLDVAVALDTDGSIGEMYEASAIPQTVIVGRDGKVAVVHVGLWAMPTAEDAAGMTADEESKLIHNTLADALREELREVIEAETGAKG